MDDGTKSINILESLPEVTQIVPCHEQVGCARLQLGAGLSFRWTQEVGTTCHQHRILFSCGGFSKPRCSELPKGQFQREVLAQEWCSSMNPRRMTRLKHEDATTPLEVVQVDAAHHRAEQSRECNANAGSLPSRETGPVGTTPKEDAYERDEHEEDRVCSKDPLAIAALRASPPSGDEPSAAASTSLTVISAGMSP